VKAYAIKKAIISLVNCPEPVSQFLVLWKSLESSSIGANSRFGLGWGYPLECNTFAAFGFTY
jgi:hypothetical protein